MPQSSRPRYVLLCLAVSALLAACGGGDGNPEDPVDPAPPPPPPPPPVVTLAGKYTGSWSACVPDTDGGESAQRHSVILGEATGTTAGFHYTIAAFSNRDCSGGYIARYQELGIASFVGATKRVDGIDAERTVVDVISTYHNGALANLAWQASTPGPYKRLFGMAGDGSLSIADLTADIDADGYAQRLLVHRLVPEPALASASSEAFADRYVGTWGYCSASTNLEGTAIGLKQVLRFTKATHTVMAVERRFYEFDNVNCSGSGVLDSSSISDQSWISMGQSMVRGTVSDRYLVRVTSGDPPQHLAFTGVAAVIGRNSLKWSHRFPDGQPNGYPGTFPSWSYTRD